MFFHMEFSQFSFFFFLQWLICIIIHIYHLHSQDERKQLSLDKASVGTKLQLRVCTQYLLAVVGEVRGCAKIIWGLGLSPAWVWGAGEHIDGALGRGQLTLLSRSFLLRPSRCSLRRASMSLIDATSSIGLVSRERCRVGGDVSKFEQLVPYPFWKLPHPPRDVG